MGTLIGAFLGLLAVLALGQAWRGRWLLKAAVAATSCGGSAAHLVSAITLASAMPLAHPPEIRERLLLIGGTGSLSFCLTLLIGSWFIALETPSPQPEG